MNYKLIKLINKLIKDEKLINISVLGKTTNRKILKIKTNNNNYVLKFFTKPMLHKPIEAEKKNLIYFKNKNINFFPNVLNNSDEYLLLEYIDNDGIRPKVVQQDFIEKLIKIHSFTADKYGFDFVTNIGSNKQINTFNTSWIDFFINQRFIINFEQINKKNPMPRNINIGIEKVIKQIHNFLPKNPPSKLLHGDIWPGNILYKNQKVVGFIDPGSLYGHAEMEIAYLRWMDNKYFNDRFLNQYSEINKIEKKEFFSYEFIYQIYFSLMNINTWNRSYIKDLNYMLKNIKL